MNSNKRQPQSIDLWSALSVTAKLGIIAQLIHERSAHFRRTYPAVTGMGAGYRVSRVQHEPHFDEVCLRFTVRTKSPKSKLRDQVLPAFVTRTVTINGKKLTVRIPTDVSAYTKGRQQGTNLTQGIEIGKRESGISYGAACCVVSDTKAPANKYLLTCQHVADPRLDNKFDGSVCVSSAEPQILGACDGRLGAMPALDAVLVPLRSSFSDPMMSWSNSISSFVDHNELHKLVDQKETLLLLCRSSRPAVGKLPAVHRTREIEIRIESVDHDDELLKYNETQRSQYRFGRLFKYYFLTEVTVPGDSGSAIVTTDGRLVGMHFYGMLENEGKQGERYVGFGIEAAAIFEPGKFGINIELPKRV